MTPDPDILLKQYPEAITVVKTLEEAGHQALWAGGCVRDLLLGRPFKDIDIATSATPDEVESLFDHTHAIGKAFGVIQVVLNQQTYEVATFREDRDYLDGRHPEGIVPSSVEEDVKRRDFTINGLLLHPVTGDLLDWVGGQEDLRHKRIRAIGDPEVRFREDHLRLFRAVRFASTLGFDLDPTTEEALQRNAHRISQVSPERIQSELVRTLTESPRAGDALVLLRDTGLLEHLLPEMLRTIGCEQPPEYHPEGDVWTHTVMMLNELDHPSPALALATLLHDIGKPQTRTVDDTGRIRFMGHAQVGAAIADTWLRELRVSNALRRKVVGLVDRHMNFMNVPKMRKATLRKVVAHPDYEDEIELHRVDCLCSNGITESVEILREARQAYEAEAALPDPLITGRDLIALGIPKGPEIGLWKDRAYDHQLEHPEITKQELMNWLKAEHEPPGS